jgi:Ca-activated chloride channel family protein
VKEAAKRAAERGVKIYTVGIGTTEGELIPGESGYVKDRAAGREVAARRGDAEAGRGRHGRRLLARGRAVARLADLYRDYIDTLEKRDVASTLEKRFEQRFQLPLALAIVLLALEPLARRAARRRAPAAAARGAEVRT